MKPYIPRGFGLWMSIIIGLAAILRCWQLTERPGWDWDESLYASIGANLANHDLLQAKTEAGMSPEAYLYHPPLYFAVLGLWFRVFGTGINSGRSLAAAGSLLMLVLLGVWLRRLIGEKWALLTVAILAIDGWMIFTNRVGWIENTMMPIGIIALWLYGDAVKKQSLRKFVIAGLILALATVYKHVGIYFLGAVLLNWAILRTQARRHLALLGTFLTGVATYIGAMSFLYGTLYWTESTVQIQRILGMRESRGALGLGTTVRALTAQYKIFAVTLVIVAIGCLLACIRLGQIIRRRNFTAITGNSLLFSWMLSAILCFGAMQLKLPHYFIMIIVPAFCYLASELRAYELRSGRYVTMQAMVAVMAVIVVSNTLAYTNRFVSRDDNAYKSLKVWAQQYLPANAVVVTEESVGAVIPQPYCKIAHAGACDGATYIITLTTHTQQPPDTHAVHEMLATSTPVAAFHGFKEHLEVRALNFPWGSKN